MQKKMVNRPFSDLRPVGPVLGTSSDREQTEEFESIEDLPDSPMLKQYVKRMVEKTGQSEKAVINSKPVESYMKRLGVWSET